MKKKITIIISVIIALILAVVLAIATIKPDSEILQSEKSYLEMLVRNQKLENVDRILKRVKTRNKRYQGIEKAYKNYYLDYINNIKDIQNQISKATSKSFISFNLISRNKESLQAIKNIIDKDITVVDQTMEKYRNLNKKEEMLKYAKEQGLSEEDEKEYYKMAGGDSEVKEDDTVLKKLILTKENYKMQENLINYLIEQEGNYTVNQVNKTIDFKDEEKASTYKNLNSVIEYNISEILINNKAISNILDNIKKNQNNTVKEEKTQNN